MARFFLLMVNGRRMPLLLACSADRLGGMLTWSGKAACMKARSGSLAAAGGGAMDMDCGRDLAAGGASDVAVAGRRLDGGRIDGARSSFGRKVAWSAPNAKAFVAAFAAPCASRS